MTSFSVATVQDVTADPSQPLVLLLLPVLLHLTTSLVVLSVQTDVLLQLRSLAAPGCLSAVLLSLLLSFLCCVSLSDTGSAPTTGSRQEEAAQETFTCA